MTDDQLMDMYALTPICLRVALSLANTIGTIPRRVDDPRVIAEKEREADAGFPKCTCSNCDPEAAEMLVCNLPRLTKANYQMAMEDVFKVDGFLKPIDIEAEKVAAQAGNAPALPKKTLSRKRNGPLDTALKELADELVSIYKLHYIKIFGDDDYCESEDYFGIGEARTIVNSLDNIKQSQDIEQAMGGDIIEGGVKLVFEYLEEWRKQDIALQYSQKQAKLLEMKSKADDKRVLADVTNVKQIPTGPAAATKKKRRSSAQVKADKEAAILKADFNRRCLKWMKEDNVPADKLDEREEAYQNDLKQQASGNAQVDFCDTRL
ncbi:uncharacterized protein MELLADRAFT_104828 [Melampsora larici-populina 98AG31]|uniref:Uncharacterized protein n=1 Tax=Melampsora larici-populina (strain 98AG31 / pathotype 3-4-7) TaxID=747676 RepID=F4RGB5_MELLP|nr:uncharacterized protein MELLADRAFT_104828 [Melampsora larici-populina 98AG31]EGG08693.1 hypothetical protein MELLADRAFT_104828 [Melampsora larici-populina 98AG31]